MPSTDARLHALALATLLLTLGMAGCIGEDPGDAPSGSHEGPLPWASFEDARNGTGGPIAEPEDSDASIRVQWAGPAPINDVPQEQQALYLIVLDEDAEAPIEDAQVEAASWMPMMDHGTSGEESPEHVDHGVYEGVINPSMEGEWRLEIDVTLADGNELYFEIPYQVGQHAAMQNEDEGEDETLDEEEEPEGFEATFTGTIESSTEYEESYEAPVNSTNFTIDVGIQYEANLPTAQLNVTLVDPDGEALESSELSGSDTGSITVSEPPTEGTYSLEVTGSAVDAEYTLRVTVE